MTQVPMITIKKMQTRRTGKNNKEGVVSKVVMMIKMIILKNKEMETTLIMMTKFS